MCIGRINNRTPITAKSNLLSSNAAVLNERNYRYISPVFTTNDQQKQEVKAVNEEKLHINENNTVEILERHRTPPPEKPPRSKPEAQRTRNTVENKNTSDTSDETKNSPILNDSELSVISVIDILKKSESTITSEDDCIRDKNTENLLKSSEKSLKTASSTSSISSRDNNLPIKSLPGPPIPDRPLRPSLSCYADLPTVGAKNEEFHKDSSHRRVGYRMAKSSSRIFSACISGQKDDEGTTMKLRRSTSEGKVGKDKKNESRATKSRSVHFDGKDEGKYIYLYNKLDM